MILLRRERAAQAIPARFRGPKRIATERELLDLRRAGRDPSSGVWKTAKDQLRRESGSKCGYCEAPTALVAHGDVEHFRPKTIYWWLAYCYDNYVFACQLCNQTFKGANFPCGAPAITRPDVLATATDAELDALAGTLGPDPLDATAVQQFLADTSAELAGIPDPYTIDPERLFAWDADDTLQEVTVRARDGSPDAARAFAAVTRFLGLNRDELKRSRYDVYEPAVVLAQVLKARQLDAANTQRTERTLRRMMEPESPFSAMVRHFVREVEGLSL